jgi:hypothetical protein
MFLESSTWNSTAAFLAWKASEERQTLEWWEGFFKHIDESDFLTGRKKDFICDLDWILTFKNFEKIRAGNYHRN